MDKNKGNEAETLEKRKPNTKLWLQRGTAALLITVAIQFLFHYLKYGEFSRFLSFTSLMEFTFTFLYFLSLFWVYPKISRLVQSPVLSGLKGMYVKIIEGGAVVLSTSILTFLMKMLPLAVLIWRFNAQHDDRSMIFDVAALRQNLIVHAVLGLFLYYFVERERIRKQIQAAHLQYARLQREEFKGQLENLKNQMNPKFLFHSLETLDTLIDKEGEEAAEFVKRLSFVYRSFLKPEEQLVPLTREIKVTEAYIYVIKLRFGEKIEFNIKPSPQSMSLQLPPGSIQLLVDHAIFQKEGYNGNPFCIKIWTGDEKVAINYPQITRLEKPIKDPLKNLKERYKYFTDKPLEIVESNGEITVKLPLLKVEKESTLE